MRVFIVNSDERRVVEQQLQEAKDWIERSDLATISPNDEPPGPPYGIVITGQSLVGSMCELIVVIVYVVVYSDMLSSLTWRCCYWKRLVSVKL